MTHRDRVKAIKRCPKGHVHPYVKYVGTSQWKIVKKAIEDLVGNQDMTLLENEEYVVGYICKQIELRGTK